MDDSSSERVSPKPIDAANTLDAAPPVTIEIPDRPQMSQGQWALIWREFRKRKLALAAGVLIIFLIASAIFAPFLAHDRPLLYRGYNVFQYREASRTLGVLLRQASEEGPAGLSEANLRPAVRRQFELFSEQVTSETATTLWSKYEEIDAALVGAEGPKRSQELLALRSEFRREFGYRQVEFALNWHSPVVRSLTYLDVLFILLFCGSLLTAGWLWLLSGRRSVRRLRGIGSGVLLLIVPLMGTLLWWLLVPELLDRTDYKQGVSLADAESFPRAPAVYDGVMWPLVPYGIDESDLAQKYLPPALYRRGDWEPVSGWDKPHWLGTDGTGRDILSRMIWGGRVSLSVGVVAVSIYVTIGIIVGAIAGYFRGIIDLLISRLIEIVICFPSFFLILTIVALMGPSIFNIMVVIGLTGWTGVARLVRGEFLRLGEQEFVLAGQALGYSPPRLIFRHVLPNALAPVLVSATFGIAGAILTESGLSFLGVGISAPTPSWGAILATGRNYITIAPWLIQIPGIAIFLTITAYNLVGEAFRDAADPRLRGR